jgi:hypothetical protein
VARSEDQRSTEAAEALEHLGRLSLRELSMESLLQSMADLTKRVMPGDPEASVTLLIGDQPSTVVDTGPLALDLVPRLPTFARSVGGEVPAER